MTRLLFLITLLFPLISQAGFDEAVAAYESGDFATAVKEYRALAEQSDPRAEFALGFHHHYGYGVPKDQAEAIKWFRLAASHGDVQSRYYLGIMHQKGEGVAKDLVAAHMWLSLYSRNAPNHRDQAYTKEIIDGIERKLNEEQIAQAKKIAKEWKPDGR